MEGFPVGAKVRAKHNCPYNKEILGIDGFIADMPDKQGYVFVFIPNPPPLSFPIKDGDAWAFKPEYLELVEE